MVVSIVYCNVSIASLMLFHQIIFLKMLFVIAGIYLCVNVVKASADGLYVRRLPSAPVINDVRQWILSMRGRSVVIVSFVLSQSQC